MKTAIVGTLLALVSANQYDHPINEDIVNEIKKSATTWVPFEAHENPLRHHSKEHLMGLLGTILKEREDEPEEDPTPANGLPESFDARVAWPHCVHKIRD